MDVFRIKQILIFLCSSYLYEIISFIFSFFFDQDAALIKHIQINYSVNTHRNPFIIGIIVYC